MPKQPPRKTTPRTVFPLSIPSGQYERITEAATLSDTSIAAFIRAAALKAADKVMKKAA